MPSSWGLSASPWMLTSSLSLQFSHSLRDQLLCHDLSVRTTGQQGRIAYPESIIETSNDVRYFLIPSCFTLSTVTKAPIKLLFTFFIWPFPPGIAMVFNTWQISFLMTNTLLVKAKPRSVIILPRYSYSINIFLYFVKTKKGACCTKGRVETILKYILDGDPWWKIQIFDLKVERRDPLNCKMGTKIVYFEISPERLFLPQEWLLSNF